MKRKIRVVRKRILRVNVRKRILVIIFTIIFLDVLLSAVDSFFRLDFKSVGILIGFTFFAMAAVAYVVSQMHYAFDGPVVFGMLIGTIGLVAQGLFSIAYATSYGSTYPLNFVVLLVLKNVILGLSFGAFASWLAERLVR